ncbi:hypothetical protein ABIB94_008828 [Bradyrhizobium sp. JR7.2]
MINRILVRARFLWLHASLLLAPKPAAIYNYSSICALDATDVVWPKTLVWNLHHA